MSPKARLSPHSGEGEAGRRASWIEHLLLGGAAGLCLTAAVVAARWLTVELHSPVAVPYDLLVIAGGLALAFGLAALMPRPRPKSVRWELVPSWLVALMAVWIWSVTAFEGSWNTVKVGLAYLMFQAGALLIPFPGSARLRRLPFSAYVLLLSVGLGLSLWGSEENRLLIWIFPVVLAVAIVLGVRRGEIRLSPAWIGASVAAASIVLLGLRETSPASLLPPRRGLLERTQAASPSVILIVLDTLRRDHMSLYGYERPTTPNIDRWAEDALVFEDMTTTASWTLPSHASMFTGQFPRTHSARGYRGKGKKEVSRYILPREAQTLAEVLSQAGVLTAGIVSNHYLLNHTWGMSQGFLEYLICRPERGYRFPLGDALAKRYSPWRYEEYEWPYYRADLMTNLALAWMRERGEDPFFLFLNYMDVHRPNWRPPTDSIPLEQGERRIAQFNQRLPKVLMHRPLPDALHRSLINAYDRELMVLDAELTRLFAFLEESGRAENTYVIVTSDHGEHFGEHDLIDHMVFLYNELVDVPLIVKGPGVTPGRSERPVQSVDIFPTVLSMFGLDQLSSEQGRSVLGDRRRAMVSEWYSASDRMLREKRFQGRFDHDLTTIRLDHLRLHQFADGQAELYDLESDPRELRDLAAELPGEVGQLQEELERWREAHPLKPGKKVGQDQSKKPELTDFELEQIEALGYAEGDS